MAIQEPCFSRTFPLFKSGCGWIRFIEKGFFEDIMFVGWGFTGLLFPISKTGFPFTCGLRVYPVRFGRKVCELMPELMSRGEGHPKLECLDPAPAHELLAIEEWSDWPEANLVEALRYLRQNKSLSLPPQWRAVFPRALWTGAINHRETVIHVCKHIYAVLILDIYDRNGIYIIIITEKWY